MNPAGHVFVADVDCAEKVEDEGEGEEVVEVVVSFPLLDCTILASGS